MTNFLCIGPQRGPGADAAARRGGANRAALPGRVGCRDATRAAGNARGHPRRVAIMAQKRGGHYLGGRAIEPVGRQVEHPLLARPPVPQLAEEVLLQVGDVGPLVGALGIVGIALDQRAGHGDASSGSSDACSEVPLRCIPTTRIEGKWWATPDQTPAAKPLKQITERAPLEGSFSSGHRQRKKLYRPSHAIAAITQSRKQPTPRDIQKTSSRDSIDRKTNLSQTLNRSIHGHRLPWLGSPGEQSARALRCAPGNTDPVAGCWGLARPPRLAGEGAA